MKLDKTAAHQKYHILDGTEVPGVTTIIGKQLGWNKGALTGWARKMGAQGLDADLFSLRLGLTRRVNALTITSGLFYRNANNNNDVNDRRTNIFLSMKREF